MKSAIYCVMTIFLLQGCKSDLNKEQSIESNLIGSWELIADQALDSDGNVIAEDRNVNGLIIYTSNGEMSAQLIWQGERDKVINDSILDKKPIYDGALGLGTNTFSDEENRKLIDTYTAYFGTYTIDTTNHIVTHIVTANIRPNKKGTAKQRSYKFENGFLFLKGVDPNERWQVKWKKIEN